MGDTMGLASLNEYRGVLSPYHVRIQGDQPPINQEQSLYQEADHAHTFTWGSQPPNYEK